MVNQQVLQGRWNEVKGKLRSRWGQLTNDELKSFNGNVDQLIGLIQRKTGEGREAVEEFLESVSEEGASAANRIAEGAQDYLQRAGETLQEGTERTTQALKQGYDTARESYEETEEFVRRRPSEAATICFGAGLLTGVLVGLLVRRN